MSENDTIHIRDKRTKNRFFVDNAIISEYGSKLGPYGIAVYCALCFHADVETQQSFPSYPTIAAEIGCSVRKVKSVMAQLVELGLVAKEGRIKDGAHQSNLYTLLNPPPTEGWCTTCTRVVHHMHEGSAPRARGWCTTCTQNNPNRTILIEQSPMNSSTTPAVADEQGDKLCDPVVQAYMRCIPGMPSPHLVDQLLCLVDECEEHRLKLPRGSPGADVSGQEWVLAAIDTAARSAKNGRFNLRYLEAILNRWELDGFMSKRATSVKVSGGADKDYAEGW